MERLQSRNKKRVGIAIVALLVGCVGCLAIGVGKVNRVVSSLSFSRAVLSEQGAVLRVTLNNDGVFRLPVDFESLSAATREGFLLREDRWFYFHPGVNPWSLVRAAVQTYIAQDRRIGGSTISMQLARLLFDLRTRTITGKFHQLYWAGVLELALTKKQIFELYLNLAPFGGNIEGIETASQFYFEKPAGDLSDNEVASLVVVPQNPSRFAPHIAGAKYLKARQRFVKRWQQFRQDTCLHCNEMPLVDLKPAFPFRAPHFVEYVLDHERNGQVQVVQTSLSDVVQSVAEEQIRAYVRNKSKIGVYNAAALIVDHRSMEIKAMVGSADYFAEDIAGQVNGTSAKRSPGSTLKPFIYGLGIDQGILHPRTLLKDTPMSFAAFTPENSDGDFSGPLSTTDALVRSRNVPAIFVASKLLAPSLYDFLGTLGISDLKEEGHYGLALALGGAELSMIELIELYGLLPRRGKFLAVSHQSAKDHPPKLIQALSAEAAYMVQSMLSGQQRPDQQLLKSAADEASDLFWKTGTSAGFKDAWAIGGVGQYLIGVWVGNFSGEGNRAFTGREASVPLFLKIVDGLRARSSELPPDIFLPTHRSLPQRVAEVEVCAVSGSIPAKFCRAKTTTLYIPGVSPIKRCAIHRQVEIDQHTGHRLCPSCRVGRRTAKKVYEQWPSDILHLFKLAGLQRKTPPSHQPGCRAQQADGKIEILAPKRGLVYLLENDVDEHRDQLSFEAVSNGGGKKVSWFVGNEYLGSSEQGEKLFWRPRPGEFEVRAVDDRGHFATRRIRVQVAH